MPHPMDEVVKHYENRVMDIAFVETEPIPLHIPMSRSQIVQLLHRAQVVEIRDPQPKEYDESID